MNKTKLAVTGIVCGLVNGLFGSGGGVISVLALERFCKIEKKKTHATTVVVILALSVVSIFFYYKNGFEDIPLALKAAGGGIIGGILGAKLLDKMPTKWIGRVFGVVMIVSAIMMVFR